MTQLRHVLLVEDSESAIDDICLWLDEENYHVTVARGLDEARELFQQEHFHAAIVDISLAPNDKQNIDGYRLIQWINSQPMLKDVLPCIVLTGYERDDLAAEGMGRLPVKFWVRKNLNYSKELIDALSATFGESVRINFVLGYDDNGEEALPRIADHVGWPEGEEKPDERVLVEEIRDLLGKQFRNAARIYFNELTKGLSGAAVIKVRAKWGNDYGPAYVFKIGRRDKVQMEFSNYEENVEHFLPANTAAGAQVVYSGHLGAIQYKFAEDANKPLREFDEFFQREPVERVTAALHSLFDDTCRYWYASPDPEFKNLIALYYKALNLDEEKLTTRIRQFLREFDPAEPRLSLPDEPTDLINPLYWLQTNRDHCTVKVYHSISHGDLTGRNVFVTDQGHCWLIDFYRTYRSHLLRDFVILETDIKYRLLPELFQKAGHLEAYSWDEYRAMEKSLLDGELSNVRECLPEVCKAAETLLTMRSLANDLMAKYHRDGDNIRRQVLLSQLVTHLNVTRLKHVDTRHKLWALGTAGHICEELDLLPPPR